MKPMVFGLASACAALILSSPMLGARAADLPSRAAPPVFVPPIIPETWAGCYVGGFGGVDIARVRNLQNDTLTGRSPSRTSAVNSTTGTTVTALPPNGTRTTTTTTTVTTNTTTITTARAQSAFPYGRTFVGGDGGGRVGCNYQSGRIVFGAQLEGGYLGIDGTSNNPFRATSLSRVSGGPYGALTGKLGYALLPKTLFYVRGGVGYANLRFSTLDNQLGYVGTARGSQVMPLVGAGIEYKLSPQISLTGEYTYLRPGCRTANYAAPSSIVVVGGVPVDRSVSGSTTSCVDKHMIAFGLNYYFTEAVVPVVARY